MPGDYAQSLIDAFSIADQPPYIAVSVDMLDTGIDVPEVVNLVFFKRVRSNQPISARDIQGLEAILFAEGGPGSREDFAATFGDLYEPPFTKLDDRGIDGILPGEQADRVVELIERVNANARVA